MNRTMSFPGRLLSLAAENARDMLETFEPLAAWQRALLGLVLMPPALAFALTMLAWDRRIGRQGVAAASAWLLRRYYAGLRREGAKIPAAGGVLLVSNHPGIGDSLALLSMLVRPDLRIVVHDRPFFQALPNLRAFLLLVPMEESRRAAVVPRIKQALRDGCLVMLYPAGDIEPDPFIHPEERMPFGDWSPVLGWLVHRARREGFDFAISTVVVDGVFSRDAFQAPWVQSEPDRARRERKAAGHVVTFGTTRRQTIRLRVAEPLPAGAACFDGTDPLGATLLVRETAANLLKEKPAGPDKGSDSSA